MICVMDDCLDIVRDVTEGRWTLSVVGGLGRRSTLPVDGEVEPNIGILEMDEDKSDGRDDQRNETQMK